MSELMHAKVLPQKEAEAIIANNQALMKKYQNLVIASKQVADKKNKELDEKFQSYILTSNAYIEKMVRELHNYFFVYQDKMKELKKELGVLNFIIDDLSKTAGEDF